MLIRLPGYLALSKMLAALLKTLLFFGFLFSLAVVAQERGGWQFDSKEVVSGLPRSDTQQVYELLLGMLDRWNAHDIEGHLEVYWRSPGLLVVIDSEQFNGWQQLHDSYVSGYRDPSTMGFIDPGRIQVKLLKPDLALALTWWSITFPTSSRKVVGNTTMNLQKFENGWKIVAAHTSTGNM
jgi:uncharacterized protein (TIGR02246 family)